MKNTFHYAVNLLTQTFDKDGNSSSDTQSFTFDNPNLLEARRAAIAKAKELEEECDNNPNYVSPAVAAARSYRDFSSYSVSINFLNGDDLYDLIDDADSLEYEFNVYAREGINVTSDEIDTEDGEDTIEVISEDLDYLLN